MARLNITIPDDLYGRLDQHRDQLNLSRICAASLQEEVERLAGQPGPPDPTVTTLLLRLRGSFERWYGRGFADGRSWTAGQASPRELRVVATAMEEWSGEQLQAALEERRTCQAAPSVDPMARPPLFPDSFDLTQALHAWAAEDCAEAASASPGCERPAQQEFLTYLEGWRDGVIELWRAAEPLLRRSIGGLERQRQATGASRTRAYGSAEAATTGHTRSPAPAGWSAAGDRPEHYEMRVDPTVAHTGTASALIRSTVDDPEHFGTLLQHFGAQGYCGKRLRLTAYLKAADVQGWAGLWMRVDGPPGTPQLSFDNMQDRPIRGTSDWQRYAVVLAVPEASRAIYFGVLLHGIGAVWLDDISFEVVGAEVPVTTPTSEVQTAPTNLDFED